MIERIIKIRKNFKLSQEQFAKRLGLSRSFINQFETGKRNLSDRTISDICREFKVNEIWIRTGIGEPFREMTRKESIASFMGEVLAAETDDIRFRVQDILSRLTVDEWEFIEKMLSRLAEEYKGEKNK